MVVFYFRRRKHHYPSFYETSFLIKRIRPISLAIEGCKTESIASSLNKGQFR
jgi:hypothetical protein